MLIFYTEDVQWFVQLVWKAVEIVMICEITCLENMLAFISSFEWHFVAGVNILQTLVLFSLLIQIVSDGSDKPMMWCYSCKVWSSQKSRVWGSKLFWCIEGGANTEDRATTFIDSPQLHWTAWTLQINQSAVFYDLNQFLLRRSLYLNVYHNASFPNPKMKNLDGP